VRRERRSIPELEDILADIAQALDKA